MQIILQLSKDARQGLGKSESGPGPPGGRDGASCLLKFDNRSAQLRAEAGKEAKTLGRLGGREGGLSWWSQQDPRLSKQLGESWG